MRSTPTLVLALALGACGGNSSSFSFDAKSDGNATVDVDNGTVAIKGGGFEGSFKMPKMAVTAADFDINGVKLYPGSTLADFHLSGEDKQGGDQDKGNVSLRFESPAPLAKVQDWFRTSLTEHKFKFAAKGDGFAGTTDDGNQFNLELSSAGGKTKGKMEVHN